MLVYKFYLLYICTCIYVISAYVFYSQKNEYRAE